jgi:hypothetical protein
MFSSPGSLFKGKVHTNYEDPKAWHNVFRNEVTMRIDESVFSPLFSDLHGRPNASIRVMVGMMILKEAEGISDQKLFEDCRYNMLYRSALGLLNINDPLPTESTYYLFRKKVAAHGQENEEDLFSRAFSQITAEQCSYFNVSGKRVRMDSKLIASNIAWLSRYELIHKTLGIHYKAIKDDSKLCERTKNKLEEALKIEAKKVVHIHSAREVKSRLVKLGSIISEVLDLVEYSELASYQLLKRVFSEQYKLGENQVVMARDKEEISAQSVQSPYDSECTYRKKGDKEGQKKQQIKGYSANVTETCDDDNLNLITQVNVQVANTPDSGFFKHDIEKTQEIVVDKIEDAHTDGAYNSVENQEFCIKNGIELRLKAITGNKGRYEYEMSEDQSLTIRDTHTNEIIENTQISGKDGTTKWRIKTEKGYRYIKQKEVDAFMLRKKIAETPKEILNKRNNVEATIFQLGYHCSNSKSKYRGLIKHRMWANIRSLWLNFVRIFNYVTNLGQKTNELAINLIKIHQIINSVYQIIKCLIPDIGKIKHPHKNYFLHAS